MNPITITLDYEGMKLTLSPETSMRYRKLAAKRGVSVERAVLDALSKAQSVGNALFLPAKC